MSGHPHEYSTKSYYYKSDSYDSRRLLFRLLLLVPSCPIPVPLQTHRPIQPQPQIPCLVIFRWSDNPIPRPSPDSCCRPSAAKEGMHRSMHVSCANLKKHFAEQFLEANHPQVPQCPGFHLAGRLLDSRIRIRYLIFAPTNANTNKKAMG